MNHTSQKISVIPHTEALPASISRWPLAARQAAEHMMAHFGPPNKATDSKLIWLYNSPWKRTVVFRNGMQHKDPYSHSDVLAQTVEYRVPPQKVRELAAFNSSLVVDIAREELTAHCDSEQTNCMVLNLANDIIIGKRTAQEAHEALHSMSGALRLNWPELYAQGLQFDWHDRFAETQRRRVVQSS